MACHLRRRAWPGAAGIGPATCKAEELQHIYYDREASLGFACCNALLFMVGMRWRVDPDWTRGQCRANGRDGVPLETAGVAESSRHRPGHLQDRRELQHIFIVIGKRLQDLQVAVRCCSWSACDGEWTLIGLGARAVSMRGMAWRAT